MALNPYPRCRGRRCRGVAALSTREVQEALDAIARDPVASMDRLPPKRDATGKLVARIESAFSPEDIRSRRYVALRDRVRSRLHGVVAGQSTSVEDLVPRRALIAANDRPEDLVDRLELVRLEDIDAAGLRKASLETPPWGGYYWPFNLGGLGQRYADPDFSASGDWKARHEHVLAHPASDIVAKGDAAAIDRLSPAEKYDLLIGDERGGITAEMWKEGELIYKEEGKVESWMGFCHGWAPASYMLPRPRAVVEAIAADGRTALRFYPADIKALATLLWAVVAPAVRLVGGRCREKDPPKDENGRLIQQAAFDTNPATWHLAAVNQIGRARRSFILDTTYDYEVWNQPVVGYEYIYFNPKTMKPVDALADARVARADLAEDRFSKYRSKEAAFLVGVVMRVAYAKEVVPDQASTDGPDDDVHRSVDYQYDLEIDADGKVIGGEWYQNRHPDFLWTPPPGAVAESPAEGLARGAWARGKPLPEAWRKAACAMARFDIPLARIVQALIARARPRARDA